MRGSREEKRGCLLGPLFCSVLKKIKAGNQTRTDDPFITSEVLYRLSYSGLTAFVQKPQLILYRISSKMQEVFSLFCVYFSYTFFVYEEASLPGKAENPQGQDASLFALSALLGRTYHNAAFLCKGHRQTAQLGRGAEFVRAGDDPGLPACGEGTQRKHV